MRACEPPDTNTRQQPRFQATLNPIAPTVSKISVYIIAFNEAEKVAATIESALWADEVVLIDSHSADGTADIATRLGARVVHTRPSQQTNPLVYGRSGTSLPVAVRRRKQSAS